MASRIPTIRPALPPRGGPRVLRGALALVTALALAPSVVSAQAAPRVAHQPSANVPLSAAVQVGDTFWLSGKLGVSDATRAMGEGRVGAETRNILESFDALFQDLGLGFEDVVKATVYLTSTEGYAEMNEVYREYFPEDPPAREAVIVADLVAGASLEISFVAVRR